MIETHKKEYWEQEYKWHKEVESEKKFFRRFFALFFGFLSK